MANVECPKFVQSGTARVTRLDECGNPDFGNCGFAVSDGWVTIETTVNQEDPDEFKQKNAAGIFLVNQRSRPLLNWIDLNMTFQEVDFEMFEIMTGIDLITDGDSPPLVTGFILTEENFATGNFALEMWLQTSEQPCPPGGTQQQRYGYVLLPWVVEGAILTEALTVTNDLITFSVTARTRKGTPWGVGPYDVRIDPVTTLASPLLSPIPTDTHLLLEDTELAPPEPMCGCQFLSS